MGTPSPKYVSTELERIAELARQSPHLAFTSIHHHVDIGLLREAYRCTRKDAAVGVDGETAEQYAIELEENLRSLLDRFRSGTYQAPPVRRVHIPKGMGGQRRPIGIPTFEDKVLQRAVAWLLEAIYEQDFLSCSYGFRPGRSAHQALAHLREGLMASGGWVIELDIERFFDTLEKGQLREMLDRRVRDGVVRRAIDKWLNAGVLEKGSVTHPETGTPQGGVVSPLLANIYLHEVLDRWFEVEIRPRLRGGAFLIRYADDAVLVFRQEADARRVLAVLPKRFARFGLCLHPQKTRLIRFGRPRTGPPDEGPGRGARPETFDFLGFTHYWGRSRSGWWVVKHKTASVRLRQALGRVAAWCRARRHEPIAEQQQALSRKLHGHYAYYGLSGNARALGRFHYGVNCLWRKWLDRRSQRARMPWVRFNRLLEQYPLPAVRVVHSPYRHAANP